MSIKPNDSNNNVIDINLRRKAQIKEKINETTQSVGLVLDMAERRQEILQNERRSVKRTILTEFIGAFIVIPQKGLCEVALFDISEKGLSFDLDYDKGQLAMDEEVAMRIYMNRNTYFPFIVKVSNVRAIPEEGLHRHGASLVKGTINDLALHHFVKFIESVSSCLERDSGDIIVSNLRK